MHAPLLSLVEVAQLEQAYERGAPTLGLAAAALAERWRRSLHDEETLVRLGFLHWYSGNEPPQLTGLDDHPVPSVDALLGTRPPSIAMAAETRFTLAVLWLAESPPGLDSATATARAHRWAEEAAIEEPSSRVFAEWRFWSGQTHESEGPRSYIAEEVHARYAGRGAMGAYMAHILGTRLGEMYRSPSA